jgi:hypothetical protein
MTRILALILAASPAAADTISISGTMVTISEAASPVVAEIGMTNLPMNGSYDEHPVVLSLPSLTVDATFDWDEEGQADALIVTPPDGTYCEPRSCVLRVDEGDTGTLRLMEWVGG